MGRKKSGVLIFLCVMLILGFGCAHTQRTDSAGSGGLIVVCDPGDAEVIIDGMQAGQAMDFEDEDNSYPLPAGKRYKVMIKRDGYEPYTKTVYIPQDDVTLEVALQKQ